MRPHTAHPLEQFFHVWLRKFQHELVNLPSSSTLAFLRREFNGRRAAPRSVAVLADPVFTLDDERFGKPRPDRETESSNHSLREIFTAASDTSNSQAGRPLPRLFNTRWEAREIASLVPSGEQFQALDFTANLRTATSPELGQYRIIHFATHAFIDNLHPELSGLVLSLVDEQGRPQDGFLRANEIFNLKLPAELVVLSACRTGLGADIRGEGMVNLTRGFMYAGAPRVVVSLWSLNDRATAELMVRFYRRMLGAQHESPASALRGAQLEMWRDRRWQQPYFWSAFILQGEWK